MKNNNDTVFSEGILKMFVVVFMSISLFLLSACSMRTSVAADISLSKDNAAILGELAEEYFDDIVMGGAYVFSASKTEILEADYFGHYLIHMMGKTTPTWSSKKIEQDAWVILHNVDFENKTYAYVEGNSGTDKEDDVQLMKFRNNWGLEPDAPMPEDYIYTDWCLKGVPVYEYESFISYGKEVLIYKSSLASSDIKEKYLDIFEAFDSFQRIDERSFSVSLNGTHKTATIVIFEKDYWYNDTHQEEPESTALSVVRITLS